MTRLRLCAVGVVLLLVAASCGSTADNVGRTAAQRDTANTRREDTGSLTGGGATTNGSGGGRMSRAANEAKETGASGQEAADPGAALMMGTGVSATSIKLGFHLEDFNRAASSVGAQESTVSPERLTRAVVDYVNAHGGIAGRRIDPVINVFDGAAEDWEVAAQRACSRFTEDARVFAGLTTAMKLPGNFIRCMEAHNTPSVIATLVAYDDEDYGRWPNFYTPVTVSGSQWAFYVDRLAAGGFLTKANRIGLIVSDRPAAARINDQVIKPRLAAKGLEVAAEATARHSTSLGSAGNAASDMSNAVLKFRQAGVDRVLFVATTGEGPFFFLPAAEHQRYQPRYGFTSNENLERNRSLTTPEQLRGARAVGWWPISDVAATEDPGGRPGYDRCTELLRSAGISFEDRSDETERDAMAVCDVVFFTKAALDRATQLTKDGLRDAVKGMGDAFQPASSFDARFGPDRHWGASTVRDLAFDDGCRCWKYVGGAGVKASE